MNNPREHLRCSRRGCSYTTNRSFNLERHERNHDKGKVLVSQCKPCPHCTYAAGSLHNLMRHISKKHENLTKKEQNGQQQEEAPSPDTNFVYLPDDNQEEETDPQLLAFNDDRQTFTSSLWHWGTPQQQENNFLRRSTLDEECKILDRTIKMFKLYSLVKSRGGALNVDKWDDVAAALGLPSKSGRHVRAKYIGVLVEYEKNEKQRLQECQNEEDVPSWWDDGNFIIHSGNSPSNYKQCWRRTERPSTSINVVKMIYNKYYKNYLNISKPFQRFHVKDSWLCATMLNYQALICQLHLKQSTDS